MLRTLTAGESHGPALVAILEGMPAGLEVRTSDIAKALARRRSGAGRGARMALEEDALRILSGVWRGETLGSPIAIEIANTEWPTWAEIMSVDPVRAPAGNEALTRPRPGHADLAGMMKYQASDARAILERSSARETASRVALGAIASLFLGQVFGACLVAHVVQIGEVRAAPDAPRPGPADLAALDASPVRCLDADLASRMEREVEAAREDGDTVGGVVEVLAFGLPPGLGSHVQADRRLDARLAGALMGIQAVKGVEVGDGFALASRRGSRAHDEILPHPLRRATNRAGGLEGGMTNGETLVLRAAVKPIPTLPRALATIDTSTGEAASAHHQRSDTSAVVPAAVVAEGVAAIVLAEAALEKFGGDHIDEVRANLAGYLESIPATMR